MDTVTDHPHEDPPDDRDTIAIASSDAELQAVFAPGAGMVCCSLRHLGQELLAQRQGVRAFADRGSTMGIPLLHPWANRLGGFGYCANGRVVKLAEDSPLLALDGNGLPIHGVIAGRLPWRLLDSDVSQTASRLRARLDWDRSELLAVFPFPHTLDLEAELEGAALTIVTTLRAIGEVSVPVSFGYHPYLTVPGAPRNAWRVELPVSRRLLLDENMIPNGGSEAVSFSPFELAESSWDDAFTGLAEPPRFAVSAAGRQITLEFLEGYPYAQVFSPAGEDFICFEPMTAPTNALVSGIDLPVAAPGEAFRAAFRISIAAKC